MFYRESSCHGEVMLVTLNLLAFGGFKLNKDILLGVKNADTTFRSFYIWETF